jgi:hypothetical protein
VSGVGEKLGACCRVWGVSSETRYESWESILNEIPT